MNNFFGIGTGDSSYDNRRHINVLYFVMCYARQKKDQNKFINQLRYVLSLGNDKEFRMNYICNNILSELEVSFLNYIYNRYPVTEDEYITILAGETFQNNEIRTPAGYHAKENWSLMTQMVYTTALSGPSYQNYVKNIVQEFCYPICSGMRDVKLQPSTFRLISENINSCLNQGKRLFTDLPYIENYVYERVFNK